MKLDDASVDRIENRLRKIACELEELGRGFCDVDGGGDTWSHVNKAIGSVRDAIFNVFKMRDAFTLPLSSDVRIPDKSEIVAWFGRHCKAPTQFADLDVYMSPIKISNDGIVEINQVAYNKKDRDLMESAMRRCARFFGHTANPEIGVYLREFDACDAEDSKDRFYFELEVSFNALHEPGHHVKRARRS